VETPGNGPLSYFPEGLALFSYSFKIKQRVRQHNQTSQIAEVEEFEGGGFLKLHKAQTIKHMRVDGRLDHLGERGGGPHLRQVTSQKSHLSVF